jgi:CheY-like chemotaxis protein
MTTTNPSKILVIDDDSVILDFLTELLQDEVSVSYTSSGEKALELARLHKPDLILLDVMMPGMDGFEVCQQLKGNPDTQHIPVVFLTSLDDGKDIAKGLELGAIDYITKPFDPEIVIAKIHNILSQISATRGAAKPKRQEGQEGDDLDRRATVERRTNGQLKAETNGASERRAGGKDRPDRHPDVSPDNAMERRAQGAARADRYEKPAEQAAQNSLSKFLVIALLLALAGGGGYAWYDNLPVAGVEGPDATAQKQPAEASPSRDLTEEDIQAVIAEALELPDQSSNTTGPTTGALSQLCEELPKVPWWGSASHDSIIRYVNNKNNGNWGAYIDKWEGQLEKLNAILGKDGTVIAPKLGTRLTGPVLGQYISQVETRIQITKCLAKFSNAQ